MQTYELDLIPHHACSHCSKAFWQGQDKTCGVTVLAIWTVIMGAENWGQCDRGHSWMTHAVIVMHSKRVVILTQICTFPDIKAGKHAPCSTAPQKGAKVVLMAIRSLIVPTQRSKTRRNRKDKTSHYWFIEDPWLHTRDLSLWCCAMPH